MKGRRSDVTRRVRRYAVFASITALFGLLGGTRAPEGDTGVLRILQLDVGQGDATLIITPEGKRILIDASPNDRDVPSYLRQLAIDTIDLVVASHNHADHIGGIPAVLGLHVVRAYMDNGVPHTTGIYQRTLAAVEAEPDLQYLAAIERSITVGSLTLRVLPPVLLDNSQNNNSVGLLLEYGYFRALYTGDSEQLELQAWLSSNLIPSVAVVKAAHHGSWNGMPPELVRITKPKFVLISVGANSYGHPAPNVVMQWTNHGARVHRTDNDGTLEVRARASGEVSLTTHVDLAKLRP